MMTKAIGYYLAVGSWILYTIIVRYLERKDLRNQEHNVLLTFYEHDVHKPFFTNYEYEGGGGLEDPLTLNF